MTQPPFQNEPDYCNYGDKMAGLHSVVIDEEMFETHEK